MNTLTAAEVRTILACAGADHPALHILDEAAGVVIYGPKKQRTAAFHVLYDKGLTFAGSPDRDVWVRRDSSEGECG